MTVASRPEAIAIGGASVQGLPGASGLAGASPAAGPTVSTRSTRSSCRAATSTGPGHPSRRRRCAWRLPGTRSSCSGDPRVRENEAYLTILLLSRVVTRSAACRRSTPASSRVCPASDLAFLQDLYRRVNQEGHTQASVTCPACNHAFTVDVAGEQRLGNTRRTRRIDSSRRSRTSSTLPLADGGDPRPGAPRSGCGSSTRIGRINKRLSEEA